MALPKGIFHYSNQENDFGATFRIPPSGDQIDPLGMISDLMNTAVNANQKDKQLSGVYLPMPFGLSPLNLQISEDGSSGISTNQKDSSKIPSFDGQRPSTSTSSLNPIEGNPRLRRLFLNARTICIQESKAQCDQALEEYQKTRQGGESPLESRLQSQRASPSDPVDYVQTEMAKWLLPSLGDRLEDLRGRGIKSSVNRSSMKGDGLSPTPFSKVLNRSDGRTSMSPFGRIGLNRSFTNHLS